MMNKKDLVTTKYIPIGEMLAGKRFKSFLALKRQTYLLVKPFRDNWLMAVLIKNNIFVNFDLMTKREVVEIFEKCKVSLLDEEGIYRVYKDGEVIGEWNNAREVRLTKSGRLQVKIEYIII